MEYKVGQMTIDIKTLAGFAGTSPASVSLVLNDKWHKKVKPQVAEKVKEIARKHNYVCNSRARGLVLKRNFRIGLYLEEDLAHQPLLGTFSAHQMLSHISTKLNEYGYGLEIRQTNTFLKKDPVAQNSVLQNVDAVIFLAPKINDIGDVLSETAMSLPYVVIDADLDDNSLCYICTDMSKSSELAISYFLDQGHKTIGIIRGERYQERFIAKTNGYKKALAQAGVEFDPRLIFDNMKLPVFERGYAAGEYFFSHSQKPTALFCSDNTCALGLIGYLRQKQIKVPDDVEIIGFGDEAITEFVSPALSYVKRPIKKMAETCVDWILKWAERQEKFRPRQKTCAERIVFQGTTKPLT